MAAKITRTSLFVDVEVSGVEIKDGQMVMDQKPRVYQVNGINPSDDEVRAAVMASTKAQYTPVLIGKRTLRGELRYQTSEEWLKHSHVLRVLSEDELASYMAKGGDKNAD